MEFTGFYADGEERFLALVSSKRKGVDLHPSSQKCSYVSALPTDRVIFRRFLIPLKSKKAAKQALPFQLEECLPGAYDDFLVLPHYEKVPEGMSVTVFAVQKQQLKEHLEQLPVDPEVVTAVPVALARFFSFQFPGKSAAIVCHLSRESTQIVAIHEKKVAATVSIDIGFNNQDRIAVELARRLYFLQEKLGELPELVLTGLFAQVSGIEEAIASQYDVSNITVVDQNRSIAIGAGLDAVSCEGLQFRQGVLFHKKYYRKLWGSFARKITLIAASTLLVFSVLQAMYTVRKQDLAERIEEFVALHERDMQNLRTQTGFVKQASAEELLNSLRRLKKTFSRAQKGYRFYEKPMRIAYVLDWLAALPPLASGDVMVDEFAYEMEAYPRLGALYDPYRIKAVVRLRGGLEKLEAVKELLHQEGPVVSSGSKIEWVEVENGYVAKFYLKS